MEASGAYKDALVAIVHRLGVEVLLPTTDTSITALLGIGDSCPGLALPFSDWGAYDGLSDKRRLTEAAREVGITVPEQVLIERPGDVDPADLARIGYPLVLKPSRSAVVGSGGISKHGVRIVRTQDALGAQLRAISPEAYPLLVQRRILGSGKGVFILMWEGQVYAVFAHRRIREKPPTGGVSVYRESVAVSPGLVEQAEKLLKRFNWSGVAMVEFKEEAETGTHYLMEVNARFWGSLQLAIDSGVDFPKLLVDLATGAEVEPVMKYRVGVRSRWLWGDVDHLVACLRTPRSVRRSLPDVPSPMGALFRFMVPWRPGDRYEVLRASDPRPFLRESVEWLRVLGR